MNKLSTKSLDDILEKVVKTADESKHEISKISQQSRKEYEEILEEVERTKQAVREIIDEEERLEKEVKKARAHLVKVSREFTVYTEDEIRSAYEYAHDLQVKLAMTRQKEEQLRKRRDELERRIRNVQKTIERAERLVSQVTVVINYLTGDLQSISELLKDAKEKQEFGLKILEAQEEERKRLSREIHDGPAQMLANVLMRSDMIEKIYKERGIKEALKEIKLLKKTIRDTLYEVRHIIYDLRPMALDDLGLIPTLKKYLQTMEEYYTMTGVRIPFIHLGEEKRLNPKMEVALFRLIQESVQNSLKHAKPTEIQVKLEMMDNRVTVVVKDDGIGFDPEVKKENSFGIRGMKERVELLDGKITIRSEKQKGTKVIISVPIK